jgi:hypothetical protein
MKHQRIILKSLVILAAALIPLIAAAADSPGSRALFDDRSLSGWRANEHPGTFAVKDGCIVAQGERSHLFYVGADGKADFKNFDFSAEVMTRPGANSGIFFHTAFQRDGWPAQGFEVQIDNSQPEHGGYLEMKKTGSLYGVRNVYKALVNDNEWFAMRIKVVGRHVEVRLNDTLVVDYVEPEIPLGDAGHAKRRVSHGTFALQGHDPDSQAKFRNIRVQVLPDNLIDNTPVAASDEIAKEIVQLGTDNFPLIDFHTHLKGGLTLEEVMTHMRLTGINHGIAVNGGIGFPITNNAGIEAFRQSMKGAPCYIALQCEGMADSFHSGGDRQV